MAKTDDEMIEILYKPEVYKFLELADAAVWAAEKIRELEHTVRTLEEDVESFRLALEQEKESEM